jgi:hypothetical protein
MTTVIELVLFKLRPHVSEADFLSLYPPRTSGSRASPVSHVCGHMAAVATASV